MKINNDKNCACSASDKPTYTCAVCGKEYTTILGRSNCEALCLEERKKAEAKKKELELAAEKDKRYAEVEAARHKYNDLVSKFARDYGSYSYKDAYNSCTDDCNCSDCKCDGCDDDSDFLTLRNFLNALW